MTKTGITPEQGDIVLISVPFTDLSSQKRWPVIVISSDAYNRSGPDIIVVAMTSNPTSWPFSFRIGSADLVAGTLNRPGTVRVDKIYTLAKSIVLKKFAKVTPQVVQRIWTPLKASRVQTREHAVAGPVFLVFWANPYRSFLALFWFEPCRGFPSVPLRFRGIVCKR